MTQAEQLLALVEAVSKLNRLEKTQYIKDHIRYRNWDLEMYESYEYQYRTNQIPNSTKEDYNKILLEITDVKNYINAVKDNFCELLI